MNIWLSTIGQRLDDAENTRTMLLAKHLMARGHRVTLWTSAFDHIRKEWRSEWSNRQGDVTLLSSGLSVRFMKGCGYQRNIGLARFVDHRQAASDFLRQAETLPQPDIVVASLPDHFSASAVVDYAKRRSIPSIVDIRDKWPDIFCDYAPEYLKLISKILLTRESARVRRALSQATRLVSMMESMLQWGGQKANRELTKNDKVFYLSTMESTTPDQAPLEDLSHVHRDLMTQIEGKTVFTFIGTFNKTQHPKLILDALSYLERTDAFDPEQIAVLIGGRGQDDTIVYEAIEQRQWTHGLGWLKPTEMKAILARSDVGLLPMNFPSPAFNNKAFSYLACGLPILNCALGDLADLIEHNGVGINVQAGNPAALAGAMSKILANPEQLSIMKKRSRAIYEVNFETESTYSAYANFVESVRAQHVSRNYQN